MSDKIPPLAFDWDGETMRPLHAKQADQYFTIGERYVLEEIQERSSKSHSHYFASLHEAWMNLPERLSLQFPTSEHLRKRALIQTGYCDQVSMAASSKAEAARIADFLRRTVSDFGVIIVSEATVIVLTAKSQSKRAMGAETFQASKVAVLDWVADFIAVERAALDRARAA